jgi:AraC-like DNA-binding protein
MQRFAEAVERFEDTSSGARLFEGPTLADGLRQADASTRLAKPVGVTNEPERFSMTRIGRVEVIEAQGPPVSVRTHGRAGRPGVVTAMLQLRGTAAIRKHDQPTRLLAGELCLLRASRPLEMDQEERFHTILVDVPKDDLEERSPSWRAALVRPIQADSGVPAIFRDAVLSLRRVGASLGEAGSKGVSEALIDLIGAVVCCAVPTSPDCVERSLYHKERIKRFAQLNLGNPELSVELIADSVGLSARQIHRLFADEEMSLMRWVWVQRLERCYQALLEESSRRPISEIAYAWGFNDQAHFSRTFRKHFGVSPRDLRRGDPARTESANPL